SLVKDSQKTLIGEVSVNGHEKIPQNEDWGSATHPPSPGGNQCMQQLAHLLERLYHSPRFETSHGSSA
ncbi:MAG TPA: hypothetical protein PL039_02035, partial [Kiritimatiellia bacterium]|nr:hypothetical protein [Kiritimatiellia bacterium]